MNVAGKPTRTIWPAADGASVEIIDQTRLPHRYEIATLRTLDDAAHAISAMLVRGAPLIGATAAYGMWLALRADPSDAALTHAYDTLYATRPTAVNLRWALDRVRTAVSPLTPADRAAATRDLAAALCDEDVAINHAIGQAGLALIRDLAATKPAGQPVNILTHCNAGWLATVDWGTATSPIYQAHDAGIPVHVWVDETRPRNQGFHLTAWELLNHGVPHTCIVDNAGGHLMQHGQVDLVIVGTDRTTATGDVCNKIGTYLKALAAHDNGVPFYVALPSPTIDWTVRDGVREIPIEERGAHEVTHVSGLTTDGEVASLQIPPTGSPAANPAFDVTPARLVTGLLTERGLCPATHAGLAQLFPDHAQIS
ncbi:S-methyl-5-thioribose-1-phosphate isomerase [Actomonas aquatica]|uniref:Methylthioribose-1-phosphate isomerase n=1 Tax=Actomonas aquatica TaxID=2866162 RepID=A0ABZ1CC31_9BACT|nr:S-methyl-5-thioribose-1-phosphate isomerase [Opitutus sp. WL0086]WRQ89231.1 S-methyl-5-thioribose-1-phosphate isomerase [Opitutus sp. WL0086]